MLLTATVILASCGIATVGKKEDGFFTSGSREADQRASQRMAKEKQLQSSEGKGSDAEKAAPGQGGKAARNEEKLTLYQRLGGEEGVVAIVADFTARVLEDPRVDWSRKGVDGGSWIFGRGGEDGPLWTPTKKNVATLKKHLVQFISLATGGPVEYDGKTMKAAHAGMHITNTEFDAAVGDLKASLDKLEVDDREQKELLAIVESTRPQIVTER